MKWSPSSKEVGKRLRPERAAGGERRGAAPASESAWGWSPTRSEKCRQGCPSRLAVVCFCLLLVAGCRQDMHNQPRYEPLEKSAFFDDGSSARPLIDGTVARGTLNEDEALFTGKVSGATVKEMPFQISEADLNRGQERYNIYCSPCHDQTGSGRGMVVQRGYRQSPSFHIERLKTADAGYVFDVITNGFGAMPDYRAQVAPRDRWRIVAYIRALQMSQPTVAEPAPGTPRRN